MIIIKILIFILILGAIFFTEELYRYLFCRKTSSLFGLLFNSKGHDENYYKHHEEAVKRFKKLDFKEYTITSSRGHKLKGFYYPCGADGKKIAFVIHGYRSNHIDTGSIPYDYYKSRGIDVFCCDHTASGTSDGQFIGFDVFESEDCMLWIDFLKKEFGDDVQIILHGFSMGGGTVLQMSSHCPQNVKFIVSDSGYINAKASLEHQVTFMYEPLRWINRLIAGYDINKSDVTKSLAASSLPILFVHGKDDKLVPYENGPKLFEMYSGEKDYFFPENTRHIEAMYTYSDEYGRKIDKFLEKYLF